MSCLLLYVILKKLPVQQCFSDAPQAPATRSPASPQRYGRKNFLLSLHALILPQDLPHRISEVFLKKC